MVYYLVKSDFPYKSLRNNFVRELQPREKLLVNNNISYWYKIGKVQNCKQTCAAPNFLK